MRDSLWLIGVVCLSLAVCGPENRGCANDNATTAPAPAKPKDLGKDAQEALDRDGAAFNRDQAAFNGDNAAWYRDANANDGEQAAIMREADALNRDVAAFNALAPNQRTNAEAERLASWRVRLLAQHDAYSARRDALMKRLADLKGRKADLDKRRENLKQRGGRFTDDPNSALTSAGKYGYDDNATKTPASQDELQRAKEDARKAEEEKKRLEKQLDPNGKYGYDENAPKRMADVASDLADKNKAKYQEDKDGTKCNRFVSDFTKAFIGFEVPEFIDAKGDPVKANTMFDNMAASQNWHGLGFQKDASVAFQKAQDLANAGKLVIVAYKNPIESKSGHVAAVVPNESGLVRSDKWTTGVPWIAQAGKEVFSKDKLSYGFRPDMKKNMEIYVLDPKLSAP